MIIAKAPFRLPIAGGGTDLPAYREQYGAQLITASIDKYMYVFINEPPIPEKIRLHYSHIEEVDRVEDIQHGIIREALKLHRIYRPIEITSMADLAAGTGMGSSSAFTVALLAAIAEHEGKTYDKIGIAEDACKIEINILRAPIGKQDQYASALGGINELTINKNNEVTATPLEILPNTLMALENRLQMYYTGVQRDANAVLKEEGLRIQSNSTPLRWIHQIGKSIKVALQHGDIDSFGDLLNEHWKAKRSIMESLSTTHIDDLYVRALKNGAIGGKVMGAGGGGFLLLCAKGGYEEALRREMSKELVPVEFKFEFDGVQVIQNI
jgi:D-glycero-alpha-D-manno-heptose-7-phosphate kinase